MAVRARKTARRTRVSAAGKKHPHAGVSPSAVTRAKISAALRGKKHPHRGASPSAATRAKISAGVKAAAARRRSTLSVAGSRVKRMESPAQLAALARARAAQKGRPRTAAQLAALTKARAVAAKKPRTAAQLAALSAGRQRSAQLRLIDKLVAHNRALTDAQKQVLARRAAGKLSGTAHVRDSKPPAGGYTPSPDFATYRAQLTAQVAARRARSG